MDGRRVLYYYLHRWTQAHDIALSAHTVSRALTMLGSADYMDFRDLDINILLEEWWAKISSHYVGCLFALVTVSSVGKNLPSWMSPNSLFYVFLSLCLAIEFLAIEDTFWCSVMKDSVLGFLNMILGFRYDNEIFNLFGVDFCMWYNR